MAGTRYPILLGGSIIAAAAADLESLVQCGDGDGSVSAIVSKILRAIGEFVLAAQVILNLGKGVGHVGELKRFKGATTGGICDSV